MLRQKVLICEVRNMAVFVPQSRVPCGTKRGSTMRLSSLSESKTGIWGQGAQELTNRRLIQLLVVSDRNYYIELHTQGTS